MALTDAELAAIQAARNSGVASVSYMGRTTTYRSLEEMDKIISTELARRAGGRSRSFRVRLRRDTGYPAGDCD